MRGAALGVLAAQARAWTAHAYRSRQPVRQRVVSQAARRLQDDPVDEPARQLWDNSPMESFFKTLKVERVHQLHYQTRAQARFKGCPTARSDL